MKEHNTTSDLSVAVYEEVFTIHDSDLRHFWNVPSLKAYNDYPQYSVHILYIIKVPLFSIYRH